MGFITDESNLWYKVDVTCFFINFLCFVFNMYIGHNIIACFNIAVAIFCIYAANKALKRN